MHIFCAAFPFALLIPVCCSAATSQMWEEWKTQHNRGYSNQTEAALRRAIWEKNLLLVLTHNQEASAGKHSFVMGLNHLADMTAEEINERLNGLKLEEPLRFRNGTFNDAASLSIPESVDWRERGLVGPVRNQGSCGSCWAFSSLGALEGQMKKKTGVLITLSPQNLVDCSIPDRNFGCNGGFITKSYSYIIRNRGVDSESFYPYEHQVALRTQTRHFGSNGKCRYSDKGKAAYCSDLHILPQGDEAALQAAVASVGPIAVAVNAMLSSFQLYKGGLYNVWLCCLKRGFIRMARNKKNLCGIATLGVYPIL
uniref:Cathepsin S, ortholog 1 n=1 Tax=Kryptolebias marmoratus TaxID=37003 RepID=A0A3Q3A3Y4_KRYMA